MSTVDVIWTIRANNRHEGDRETVERTPYIDALIKAGRVEVIEEREAPAAVALDAPKAVEVPVEVEVVEEVPLGEPGAEGLTVPKPSGRRRATTFEKSE